MKTSNNTNRTTTSNSNLVTLGDVTYCERQNKAKTIFHTKEEAESKARFENSTRSQDRQLAPYYCKSCGGWHLGARRHYNDSGLLGTSAKVSCKERESKQWKHYS